MLRKSDTGEGMCVFASERAWEVKLQLVSFIEIAGTHTPVAVRVEREVLVELTGSSRQH